MLIEVLDKKSDVCPICNKVLFRKARNQILCSNECRIIRQRKQALQWKINNPEKYKAMMMVGNARYYKKNKIKCYLRNKEYRKSHPELRKIERLNWTKETAEKHREYKKNYYVLNKDKLLRQAADNYLQNRDYILNRVKAYRIKNPHIKKAWSARRYAREKNGGILYARTVQMVYEDNIKKYGTLTCYLCLKPISFSKDSLEHKIPLVRGGTNEYSNLAVAHISCNSRKRHRTEQEYREHVKNVCIATV